MANPGPYPPMGSPMGGPMQPMGGPPMGPMGGRLRQPMHQGTSRLVPVVVSAGLAVGVFCGLLFGLGTGKRDAAAEPPKVSNGVKSTDDSFTPESVKSSDRGASKVGSSPGSAVAVNTGSAGSKAGSAGSAARGSNAGSAEPTFKTTKLVVEIKPDLIAQFSKISIDGKEVTGTTAEIPLDPGTTKKKIKVLVKAPGYKDVTQEIEVEGESTTLKLELIKSARPTDPTAGTEGSGGTSGTTGRTGGNTGTGSNTGTGGKGNGGSKGNGGKGKGKGSGLIDI